MKLLLVILLGFVGVVHAEESCGVAVQKALQETDMQKAYKAGQELEERKCEDDAVRVYQKAAEAKISAAVFDVGRVYLAGIGSVKRDQSKAFAYFGEAAKLGSTDAMVVLGAAYEMGDKAWPKDIHTAWDYYQRAAKLGNHVAMLKLSKVYTNGELGQQISATQAAYWRSKANSY